MRRPLASSKRSLPLAARALLALLASCTGPRSTASPRNTTAAAAPSPRGASASTPGTMAELEAQFASEITALGGVSLPAGVTVSPHCCVMVGVLGAPVGVPITLAFASAEGLSLAEPATLPAGDGYRIEHPPPAPLVILRRPNVAVLRPTLAPLAERGQRALSIASRQLTTLPRYQAWRQRSLRVTAVLSDSTLHPSEWTVYFNAMVGVNTGPEDTVNVRLDLDRGAVIETRAGARNEVIR
jgi:hypothetical protein